MPIAVTVTAADNVAIASVDLSWTGAAGGIESRLVTPPAPSRTENFSITVLVPPTAGGALTLAAVARDAAGNIGTAALVHLVVSDVVAPAVQSVSPAAGATNVDPATSIVLTFSEVLDRATVTGASVQLLRDGVPVATSLSLGTDDRTLTIVPAAALPVNTLLTVSAGAGIADRAGNQLQAFSSTFRTSSPDVTPPFVESIDPANGATGVPATTSIAVTFSEPIESASVTSQTFRITTGGNGIAGAFAFGNGGRLVTFTPASALPFSVAITVELTSGITDLAGNPLATATGDPLSAPLTFTFQTGAFAITAPAGTQVVEGDRITLAAAAGSSLQVAHVAYSVNGAAAGTGEAPDFSVGFTVPPRPTSGTITILARALNAQNVELARAEKTVAVVTRLQALPLILGVPRGATRSFTLAIDQPASEDLVVAISVVDPLVVTPVSPTVTIPAGQTSVTAAVTACAACPWDPVTAGRAAGNTSILATSARGVAIVIASVSDPVPGTVTGLAAPVGAAVPLSRQAAHIFLVPESGPKSTGIQVLPQPLAGTTPLPVQVTSSDPTVATATASDVQPGSTGTVLTIVAGQSGVATLTVRAGSEVWLVTVRVGTPPPGSTPFLAAAPVGIAVTAAPSVGQVLSGAGRTSQVTIQMLSAPNAGTQPLPVEVTSSNAAVATGVATAVAPGASATTVTITTGTNGTATLLFRAGGEVRSLVVLVGPPQPSQTPIVLAPAVGFAIPGLPSVGLMFAPVSSAASIGVAMLAAPAAAVTPVTVSSSNPSSVSVTSANPSIAAGSQVLDLAFTTGVAGTSTLTLTAGSERLQLTVVVGPAPPSTRPPFVAAPVGLSVLPSAQAGRLLVAQGAPVTARVGIQLIAAARAGATAVTITSSNPASSDSAPERASRRKLRRDGHRAARSLYERHAGRGRSAVRVRWNSSRNYSSSSAIHRPPGGRRSPPP